jgi:hypothetical protein
MMPSPSRRPHGRTAFVFAWGLVRSYGPLALVGLIFIAAALLKLLGAEMQVGFNIGPGAGELAPAFAFKANAYTGILILAVIDAIGLLRKQRWARYTGIVLGPILILPEFLDFYAESDAGWRHNIARILNPTDLGYIASILCCSAYLACFRFAADRWRSRSMTLIVFAVLSLSATALTAASILKLHGVLPAYYHNLALARQVIERRSLVGAVQRGVPYRNSEYGFELTFPDDRKIYRPNNRNSLEFSSTGLDGTGGFHVRIENSFDHQDTAEEVVRRDLRFETRNHDTVDVINGVPCARLGYWAGSFSYVFVRNGKLIYLEQHGGMDDASFDQVARTFRLL